MRSSRRSGKGKVVLTTNSFASSSSPLISVVVCTFNRADLLETSLEALDEQILESSEYEVIVVDNNSTDNTLNVVEELCNRLTSLRYCFEPNQGLSHARNRGWREAMGEYVAYIDDDCKVPGQWLTRGEKRPTGQDLERRAATDGGRRPWLNGEPKSDDYG